MRINTPIRVLIMNHIHEGRIGPFQPPKKMVVAIADTENMLRNSARKNMANFIPEYSVTKPATSSESASGRSKGVRLHSAVAATR